MSTQYVAWADGLWADGFWGSGVWEGVEAQPVADRSGGGKGIASHSSRDDLFLEQVREKWDAIERAQRKQKRIESADVVDEAPGDPVQVQDAATVLLDGAPLGEGAFAGITLTMPKPQVASVSASSVPVALSPTLAMLAKAARDADDEEALLMILMQL